MRSSLLHDLRRTIRQRPQQVLLVVVVLVGAGCGLVAVSFHLALSLAERLLSRAVVELPGGPLRIVFMLALPAAIGALLSELVPRFSPQAGGGLALVRRAYAGAGKMDMRTFAGAFLANTVSLGAGTPLGPEGPTVVLTSSFAMSATRFLGLPGRIVRGMIPVGTAAGIAAIFGAPMTGVVFAMEEIIGTASRGVLGSALLAAVAAAVVERGVLGGGSLLPAAPGGWTDPRELAGFALLGATCGVVAGAIPRAVPVLNRQLSRLDRLLPAWHRAARGATAGLLVGLLGLASPASLGIGYQSVSTWLHGGGTATGSALAFLAKAIGMSLALAAPLPGGVFAPSLFLGASVGAAMGHTGALLFPHAHIDPAAYALVGMGALFAGFLRTPIASVLIVFELTGDYGLVLPLMLAVALSSVISRRLSPETLVESQLAEAGLKTGESDEDPLRGLSVREVMSTPAIAPREDMTFLEAARLLAGTLHPEYPVVDAAGHCTGLLLAEALNEAARQGRLDELVRSRVSPPLVLLTADQSMTDATLDLARSGATRAPVVISLNEPTLIGFLSPSDILNARLRSHQEKGEASLGSLG